MITHFPSAASMGAGTGHSVALAPVYFAFQAFGLTEDTRAKALRACCARRWLRKSRVDILRLRRRGSSSQTQAKLVARRRNIPAPFMLGSCACGFDPHPEWSPVADARPRSPN